MSTYLLLRNNKQTGPFTLDELKKMSLKAYDLVWVEGKSAAWRYPGEITELASFAPSVPEQPYDRFFKKAVPETSLTHDQRSFDDVKPAANSVLPPLQERPALAEPRQKMPVNQKRENRESVYIHLPASERKLPGQTASSSVHEPIDLEWDEPRAPGVPAVPAVTGRSKRKLFLAGSIILFFIAGMLTGFYVSNRRNIYSTDGNAPHLLPTVTPLNVKQASAQQNDFLSVPDESKRAETGKSAGSQAAAPIITRSKKRQAASNTGNKDSAAMTALPASAHVTADSAAKRQEADNKTSVLSAKIKVHPEEYLLISTGNYRTGLLGGISEAPVSVTNRSGVTMDLVVVEINYIQHNRKIFKTENLSFHNLAPGMTLTEAAPKSARGIKITYRLTVANSGQIGMEYSNFK